MDGLNKKVYVMSLANFFCNYAQAVASVVIDFVYSTIGRQQIVRLTAFIVH